MSGIILILVAIVFYAIVHCFQEFFEISNSKEQSLLAKKRAIAITVSVGAGALFSLSGKSIAIWPVFGGANQLLSALALLAITVWVSHFKISFMFTLIPMLFIFAVTLTALGILFYTNLFYHNIVVLSIISILLFLLAILPGIKAYGVLFHGKKSESLEEDIITN